MALLPLAGCAREAASYPSLAVRPAERVGGTFTPPPPPLPGPMPEGTLGRLGDVQAAARAAHDRFLAQLPRARELAAAGGGAGVESDRWAAAQVALADLDSIRSQTAVALGDLDLLFAEATLSFTDRAAVEQTRADVLALIREEDRVLAGLRERVAP